MNPAAPVTNAFMRICSGAGTGDHGPRRSHQDLEVEPQGPVVDVFEVHLHPVVEARDLIAAAQLPQTRDAGTDAQLALVPETVAVELVRERGTRSDERHVAFQHAPKLRELIEAVLAEEASHRRDPRVVLDLEDGAGHFVLV